jgi:hypothetical protein
MEKFTWNSQLSNSNVKITRIPRKQNSLFQFHHFSLQFSASRNPVKFFNFCVLHYARTRKQHSAAHQEPCRVGLETDAKNEVIMPPTMRWRGHYVMAYASGVRKHFISVNYRTNAWVDWSDFQGGHYVSRLGFHFRLIISPTPWSTGPICGWLGVTGGRFLSMISAAAHSRRPLRQPSLIWFPSIISRTPESTGPIFFCILLGVTAGRFLSMTSAAAHSTWLPRQPFGFRPLSDKHLSRLVIYIS